MTTFSSPNRVVWEYFLSLRLLAQSSRDATSPELARQQAALALIMSVTVVEVFLNMWFRVRVEESRDPALRTSLLKDLADRKSIEFKLKNWPLRYLGRSLNLSVGAGARFSEVKLKRNAIVHFTSTHETVELDSYHLHGLADTTEYDSLASQDAVTALQAAQECVAEIFRLTGLSPSQITRAMHAWTGTVAA